MSDDGGSTGRSAAWGVLAAVSGAGAFAVWIAAATPGSRFPIWPAFTFGAIAAVGLYMCFAALHGWWPASLHRRRDAWSRGEFPRERPLGVGLAALLPVRHERLELALVDEDWDMWQGYAWIAAVKVRITNTTTRVIRLERFGLESDPGPGERPRLTQAQVDALYHEVRRRADAYGPSHLRQTELQPDDSISGWYVRNAYLPYPARAGRPRCVFRVTDGVGDAYELEIPARDPQVRRIEPVADRFDDLPES